jgi:UDP-N-acetylmuramoylalanine--D-glutamate ligase
MTTFPLRSVAGVPITVLGAARSGVAVAKLLRSNGADVFVSDNSPEAAVHESVKMLREHDIRYEVGHHSEKIFACDVMILSPGIPSDTVAVESALKRSIDVVSELECASWFCKGSIAAITGSNGKTTTTTLIGRMLEDMRVPHTVSGNIGTAFSAIVGQTSSEKVNVLEVSSFQLDHIHAFHPSVSVILNITPDHLDRYGGSVARYAASKGRIIMNQSADDLLVYNADDTHAAAIASRSASRTLPFSLQRTLTEGAWIENGELFSTGSGSLTSVIRLSELSLKGMHNVANAMAAILTSQYFGVSTASIRATLRNFKGVEHRLEFVRDVGGVQYVNDSKATNVDSVRMALTAYEAPIVLLLGGRDKGNDYSRLTEMVRKHVRTIVAIGESADAVETAFTDIVPVRTAGSLEQAIASASAAALPGDVVLLSPACASFDWFKNYEHRGRAFKDLVLAL